jgi:hypothetical protein
MTDQNEKEQPTQTIRLYCDCCAMPIATIDGAELIIRARHHGEHHATRIKLADLLKLLSRKPPARCDRIAA